MHVPNGLDDRPRPLLAGGANLKLDLLDLLLLAALAYRGRGVRAGRELARAGNGERDVVVQSNVAGALREGWRQRRARPPDAQPAGAARSLWR